MKIKTSELIGPALDWAVAKCEEYPMGIWYDEDELPMVRDDEVPEWRPSTDWSQGGPIIEREKIELKYLGYDNPPYWGALKFSPSKYARKAAIGLTPLIAAMRCVVASKLGDEVDVPEELLK